MQISYNLISISKLQLEWPVFFFFCFFCLFFFSKNEAILDYDVLLMVYLNATCVILNGFVSDFIGDTWSDLNDAIDWLTDWLTDWFFQYTHSNQSNSIRFDWDWKISLQVNESTLDLPRTDAVGGPIRAGIYASPPPIRQITAKASLTHMAPCPIKLNWIKLNSHQIHQQSQFINNGCNNDSFTTMIHNINSY